MSAAYLLKPDDFERMFRVIHGYLQRNHFANPHKSCTFFSVIGAAILNVSHNIKGTSRSGAAMFDLGLGKPIVFADPSSEFFTHSKNGFHSWIEADGWFIDLTSPLFPEMTSAANLGHCPRRMLQKPLTEEASSPSELSPKHCFYLIPDRRFTEERIDLVLENNRFLKIVQDCIKSYGSGDTNALSDIRITDAW